MRSFLLGVLWTLLEAAPTPAPVASLTLSPDAGTTAVSANLSTAALASTRMDAVLPSAGIPSAALGTTPHTLALTGAESAPTVTPLCTDSDSMSATQWVQAIKQHCCDMMPPTNASTNWSAHAKHFGIVHVPVDVLANLVRHLKSLPSQARLTVLASGATGNESAIAGLRSDTRVAGVFILAANTGPLDGAVAARDEAAEDGKRVATGVRSLSWGAGSACASLRTALDDVWGTQMRGVTHVKGMKRAETVEAVAAHPRANQAAQVHSDGHDLTLPSAQPTAVAPANSNYSNFYYDPYDGVAPSSTGTNNPDYTCVPYTYISDGHTYTSLQCYVYSYSDYYSPGLYAGCGLLSIFFVGLVFFCCLMSAPTGLPGHYSSYYPQPAPPKQQ